MRLEICTAFLSLVIQVQMHAMFAMFAALRTGAVAAQRCCSEKRLCARRTVASANCSLTDRRRAPNQQFAIFCKPAALDDNLINIIVAVLTTLFFIIFDIENNWSLVKPSFQLMEGNWMNEDGQGNE